MAKQIGTFLKLLLAKVAEILIFTGDKPALIEA
jgi:hypothetical protein